MKVISEAANLILAGAWNPHILQPPWVLHRVPGHEEDTQIQVETAFELGVGTSLFRHRFPDMFRYSVSGNKLIFIPELINEINLRQLQDTACNILDELKHTPVSAFGFNFTFEANEANTASLDQIRKAQEDVVDATSSDVEVVSNVISTSLRRDAQVINVHKKYEGGQLSMRFNFHHSAQTSQQMREMIGGSSMWSCFEEAQVIAQNVLHEELDRDE